MRLLRRQLLGSLVLGAAPAVARGATAPADQSPPTRTGLKTRFKNSTADWDVLFQRRFVRMIVPYSRTLFFRDKAVVYGTAANGGELLEKWINTHSRPALGQSRLNCPRSRATVLSPPCWPARATLPRATSPSRQSARSWWHSPPRCCATYAK